MKARTKEEVLEELVRLLKLSSPARKALLRTLTAREELGSTSVGGGVAIPHCRSLVVSKVLVAVGLSRRGINFRSPDRKRVFLFFLIFAPLVGNPGEYLVVLGSVAQAAKVLARDRRIKKVKTARDFIKLVKELEK